MNCKNLVFKQPASYWEEALPIGNGRMGGMIHGYVEDEVIQINDDTLWSGKPLDDSGFNVTEHLPVVRGMIDQKRYKEAHRYIDKYMLAHRSQSYIPLGNIKMNFDHTGEASNYERSLDMLEGISYVDYLIDDVNYGREYFCSYVDDVMMVRLTSDQKTLKCTFTMDSLLKATTVKLDEYLMCLGEAPINIDPRGHSTSTPIRYNCHEKGIEFAGLLYVDTDGKWTGNNQDFQVEEASYIQVYYCCKNNYINSFTAPDSREKDPMTLARKTLDKARQKGYEAIKADHIKDFSALMGRVNLELGGDMEDTVPTDQGILSMKEATDLDPTLVNNLFQFGRYLVVSASREGTQATNLQGIWNGMIQPPWSSNYTININTEMNYWPVDVANLSECYQPLMDLIKDLSVAGKVAAKAIGCKGWTANHNTDLWRQTVAVGVNGNAQYAFWPMGGPWLATHLYDHYQYNQDPVFLEEICPILRSSAEFCLDWLYEDQETGYLVTSPSTSPENNYQYQGESTSVTKASAMDMTIIWQVLTDTMTVMEQLGVEEDSVYMQMKEAREKLYPYQINEDGLLREWWDVQTYGQEGHRHVSHLCGLYPNNRVDSDEDQELIEAHLASLEKRIMNGSGHTSWSCAWIMLLYARLRNSQRTKDMMIRFFKNSLVSNGLSSHPPFQIDGNYGYTAAICEMLLQSHNGYIEVLPALPDELKSGSFTGLKARGGYIIDATWADGQVKQITIKSMQDGSVKIKANGGIHQVSCKANESQSIDL